jgi:hypothetical protein
MAALGSVDRHVVEDSVAEHRFIEVSVGIAVGLVVTAIWPLREKKAGGGFNVLDLQPQP